MLVIAEFFKMVFADARMLTVEAKRVARALIIALELQEVRT